MRATHLSGLNIGTWGTFFTVWFLSFLFRFFPGRPANLEPILGSQMPMAKHFGRVAGFLFAFINIVIFDALTSGIGVWTWVTAAAYGLLGIAAASFFSSRGGSASGGRIRTSDYVKFSIFATLAYDAVTGLTLGPLFFGQTFIAALVGQIPFTFSHLVGNTFFAVALSPVLDRLIVRQKKFEVESLKNNLTLSAV